jgi:4-carboxymuconolactone decarboxylase
LAIGDKSLVEGKLPESAIELASCHLDPKTRAFARLGASVALGANTSGFQSDVDAALAAGASVGEVVGVLIAVGPTVGMAKLVLAAPALGLAIGYDTDAGLDLLEPE